jgi:hypothetical protein
MTADDLLATIEEILTGGFELLTGEIAPAIIEAFRARGLEVAESLSVKPDLRGVVDRAAVNYARQRAGELIKNFAETTPEMLRSAISQAIEQGWSSGRLRDELRENYAFSPTRALSIARTETAVARRRGGLETAKAAGVYQKHWDIVGDDPCPLCLNNAAAGWIDIDDEFPEGEDPHPNCSDDIEYRMKAEGGGDEDQEEI